MLVFFARWNGSWGFGTGIIMVVHKDEHVLLFRVIKICQTTCYASPYLTHAICLKLISVLFKAQI